MEIWIHETPAIRSAIFSPPEPVANGFWSGSSSVPTMRIASDVALPSLVMVIHVAIWMASETSVSQRSESESEMESRDHDELLGFWSDFWMRNDHDHDLHGHGREMMMMSGRSLL